MVAHICIAVHGKSEPKKIKNQNQNQSIKVMKKVIYTLLFVVMTSFAITACSEDPIMPVDGGASDKCQFGGPGCPKG